MNSSYQKREILIIRRDYPTLCCRRCFLQVSSEFLLSEAEFFFNKKVSIDTKKI